eukprot:2087045-Rhodomonas_salina.1
MVLRMCYGVFCTDIGYGARRREVESRVGELLHFVLAKRALQIIPRGSIREYQTLYGSHPLYYGKPLDFRARYYHCYCSLCTTRPASY